MEDFGFGEVFTEKSGDGPNFSKLKKRNLPVSPVFENAQDADFSPEDLKDRQDCLCPLFKDMGDPVIYSGDKGSKFVFMGFQPTDIDVENGSFLYDESEEGLIFDSMLATLGLDRKSVFLTPTVFCRSENRVVPPKCFFACARLLKRVFSELPNVEYIFTMGTRPFELMSGVFGDDGSYIGSYIPFTFKGREVKIIPLNSPNFCVFSEKARKTNFEILEKLKN